MKKYFLFLVFALVAVSALSQVYNPSLHATVNKSLGMSQAGPTDARSYFYDENNFVYRPYVSIQEVKTYLTLPKFRTGQFDIIVNTGGTLASGVITGGTNAVYYFKDGTTDNDLVFKGSTSLTWGSITGTLSNQTDLQAALNGKQETLVSGTNIKTVNGIPILGIGNIAVQEVLVSATNIKTINGVSILGSGNIATASGDVVGPASATDNALARFDLGTGKLIQNSNAILTDGGDLQLVGALKIGTAATLDPRIKSVMVDNVTADSSFSLSLWKASGDNADLNFEGGAAVKHSKSYNLTPGYAGTHQLYGLAGSWGTVIGNNSFTGNTIPYAPTVNSQPNSYVRFELGPVWPYSEKMRINNSGDIIFGATTLRTYTASQSGTSTVNDPVNSFFAADAGPGRFFAWGNEVSGRASYMDKITGFTNVNNITTERVRTIAAQTGRVIEANAMIDTLGNGYFKIANINEVRLSQYGSSYYKLTQDAGSLIWSRVGSSTPDTLMNLQGFSRITTPRDIQLYGSHYSQITWRNSTTALFDIKADATVTTIKNNTNVPINVTVNAISGFDFGSTGNWSHIPLVVGSTSMPAAIGNLDVYNNTKTNSVYIDNTGSATAVRRGLLLDNAVSNTADNIALYTTSTNSPTDRAIFIPSTSGSGSTDRAIYSLTAAASHFAGNLGVGVDINSDATIRLEARSLTEQFRISYDASNYASSTVGSTGGVTYDAVGGGAKFTWNDDVAYATNATFSDYTTTTPAAPANGVKVFSRERVGRNLLSIIGERGKATALQPAMFSNKVSWAIARGTGTVADLTGLNFTANTAHTQPSTSFNGNFFASTRRIGMPTTAAAGTIGGVRNNSLQWAIGDAPGKNGFFMVVRGGMNTFTSDGRGIVGMTGASAAITNVEMSSLLNIIVFAHDAADTDWFFMVNDGTGAATRVALGTAGQFPCKTAAIDFYEFRIYAPSNGTTVYYSIERVNTGDFVEGSVSTDLPLQTQGLSYQIGTTNNATAAIAQFDMSVIYIESDN